MTAFVTREGLHSGLDSVTVVDAQPPTPYGQRHLPGAVNLVAEDSDEHVLGALPDTAAPVVVYSGDADCARAPELAARPASAPFEEHEGLGVGMDVELDRAPGRRAGHEDRDVHAGPREALEEERGRPEGEI